MKRVVIVGGGFAGSDLARRLGRRLPGGWEAHLYSDENHMVFTPLLPEVVGAAINPLHVVWPVREMAPGVTCRTADVRSLDLDRKQIEYTGPLGETLYEPYDHLVLCCGLAVNLDIIPGMAQHGWPLKTLGDAFALRNHVIQQLERAEAEPDDANRARLLSFVVVGGGFTGVEVAGSLRDVLDASEQLYTRFEKSDIRVTILDGGPRILGPLPEPLAEYAHDRLQSSGIVVHSKAAVKSVLAHGVELATGEVVSGGTVVASIGNAVRPLIAASGLATERGRLVVDGLMRVEGYDDVWALGDCAAVPNAFDGKISPTLGQFAVRQAKQLADNLTAVIAGREPRPFRYHTRGMFAALGDGSAVGNPFGLRVTGFLAYMLWRGIYWSKLPSMSRRLQIAVDWALDLVFRRDIVEISTLQSPRQLSGEASESDQT